VNDIHNNDDDNVVYWHRDLPPLDAELMTERTVEATSSRVPGRSVTGTSYGIAVCTVGLRSHAKPARLPRRVPGSPHFFSRTGGDRPRQAFGSRAQQYRAWRNRFRQD
jgi:hypothetical protein